MALTYRADIDGLRALAIVPVVLFHAGVPGAPGGFVGVDVFFVISGFLITSLIQKEIGENRFSYLSFWERRARRLLAPILAVTLVTLVAGWFLLLPEDLRYLGQSIAGVALFSSNLVFWQKSGYFAAEDETIPLLHSWSLAVEEQYYLVFPALLLMLAAFSPRARSLWILLIALGSLGLSVHWTHTAPDSAYYLLPSRGFELMIGALLALHPAKSQPGRWTADALALIGLALVAGAVLSYDGNMAFPGLAALVPCLGTALLIRAGAPAGSISARLLTFRPVVEVGKLSYSLYLWHWPIIVFWALYRRKPIETLFAPEITGLIVASLVLAWCSYRLVESPVRERRILASRRSLTIASLASLATLLAAGVLIHLRDGMPERLPPEIRTLSETVVDWTPDQLRCGDLEAGQRPCEIGAADRPLTFAVWGDSHAQALYEVTSAAARNNGLRGIYLSRGACPPLPGLNTQGSGFALGCPDFNRHAMQQIEALRPDFVLLVARWNAYRRDASADASFADSPARAALLATVQHLQASGAQVALVDEVPYPDYFIPSSFGTGIWRFGLDPAGIGLPREMYLRRNRHWLSLLTEPGLQPLPRLSPADVLCDADWCPVFRDGRPVYRDSNHLTNYGAALLLPRISGLMADLSCQATACRDDALASAPWASSAATR